MLVAEIFEKGPPGTFSVKPLPGTRYYVIDDTVAAPYLKGLDELDIWLGNVIYPKFPAWVQYRDGDKDWAVFTNGRGNGIIATAFNLQIDRLQMFSYTDEGDWEIEDAPPPSPGYSAKDKRIITKHIMMASCMLHLILNANVELVEPSSLRKKTYGRGSRTPTRVTRLLHVFRSNKQSSPSEGAATGVKMGEHYVAGGFRRWLKKQQRWSKEVAPHKRGSGPLKTKTIRKVVS